RPFRHVEARTAFGRGAGMGKQAGRRADQIGGEGRAFANGLHGQHRRPKRIARQVRSAVSHRQKPMPFVWDAAQYCLELPYGAIRHFPAGTYDGQVATWAGRVELELMSVAHSAWYTFKHLKSYSEWGE